MPARWRAADTDLDSIALVEFGGAIAERAPEIAERYGVRSLGAIHLATAKHLMIDELAFITFDLRQAEAARQLGLRVVGASPSGPADSGGLR